VPAEGRFSKIVGTWLRPGARVAGTATTAIPPAVVRRIRRSGNSRKIENAHPRLAARAASTVAAAGRTGFDEKSPAVAGLFCFIQADEPPALLRK
jgi:hypothetical protein